MGKQRFQFGRRHSGVLAGRGRPGVGKGLSGDRVGISDIGFGPVPAPLVVRLAWTSRTSYPAATSASTTGRPRADDPSTPIRSRIIPVPARVEISSVRPSTLMSNDSHATSAPVADSTATVPERLCGSMPATQCDGVSMVAMVGLQLLWRGGYGEGSDPGRRQIWVESCRLSSSRAPRSDGQDGGPDISNQGQQTSIVFRVRARRSARLAKPDRHED